MEIKTLWKAQCKKHKGTLTGMFFLVLLTVLFLSSVLTVWRNSGQYIEEEMERMGYGDLTVWVSGTENLPSLIEELTDQEEVSAVGYQEILYADYEIGDQESDSEGQLVTYEPDVYPYKIFEEDLSGYQSEEVRVAPGEIYVPSSLISMYHVAVGDRITFPVARSGVDISFTVRGYFEDPFMGSSMIGMKSFLICEEDYETILNLIRQEGEDALARSGYMLHIFQSGSLPAAQLNTKMNENTSLPEYMEFAHSREVMSGFMMTLQNVFTSLFLSFVLILFLVSVSVLSYSIGSTVWLETGNMGILKSLGFPAWKLQMIQLVLYLTAILPGAAAGLFLSVFVVKVFCSMTLTTTGILVPAAVPAGLVSACAAVMIILLAVFVWLRTGKIRGISPVKAAQREQEPGESIRKRLLPVSGKGVGFWLALRQLMTGWLRYGGICIVASLLVIFASFTGRVNDWLGPQGEGLMDAFNPADLDMAAQPMGDIGIEDVEQEIRKYTEITEQYDLAMPGVAVNGVDYTANVITEPERFHILEGQTCQRSDEVVLTEFVASDLNVSMGDTVTVTGELGTAAYTVSGIYQCANDMGANIGMSREGYVRIGEDLPQMWCTHYFLADPSLKTEIMEALSNTYGGDVYLHENSWPGLFGILSAMDMLMVCQYIVITLFILVITCLTSERILSAEERNLRICRRIGFAAERLRASFALRFCIVSLTGGILGTLISMFAADPVTAVLMRMEGISDFSSSPDFVTVLQPCLIVAVLFTGVAWFSSHKICSISILKNKI